MSALPGAGSGHNEEEHGGVVGEADEVSMRGDGSGVAGDHLNQHEGDIADTGEGVEGERVEVEGEVVQDLKEAVVYQGYFKKIPDSDTATNLAQCNFCKTKLKRTDGNTVGLKRHLASKHEKQYKEYAKKQEAREKERNRLKEEKKRRSGVIEDVIPTKQPKLSFEPRGAPDPKLQKKWDDALSDHIAETYSTFEQVSGPSFTKLIGIINKKIRVKSRTALSKHITIRAKDVLKEVSSILQVTTQSLVHRGYIIYSRWLERRWCPVVSQPTCGPPEPMMPS